MGRNSYTEIPALSVTSGDCAVDSACMHYSQDHYQISRLMDRLIQMTDSMNFHFQCKLQSVIAEYRSDIDTLHQCQLINVPFIAAAIVF